VVPNTSPYQIISHFDFSTYINFTIHNAPKHDIYIVKIVHIEKSKRLIIWIEGVIAK